MYKEVYLRVKGRVQGIGYRNWAVRRASEIQGLSGWVRNVETGDVEMLLGGEESKIDEMIISCYKGPMLSRVDRIEFISGRVSGFLPVVQQGVFIRI